MQDEEKIQVCAYCRVSTENESQVSSLNNQTYYFEEKTEQSGNYTLYKIYADEGLTATSWKKRIHFKEMLNDAGLDIEIYRKEIKAYVSNREPKFKRILIKDVSRFSRNASEGLELVTKLREKKVHIDFVSLGLSTEQMTNDMIIGFFLLAAENESKDKSQKILWGKKIGAERGVIHTTDNFYGYKYIKETNSLETIEEEAEVIRLIYNLYINEGFGFRKIVNYLTDQKIYTRKGKPFVQQSIKRMLCNEAYTGVLVRNKMDAPKVFTSKSYATLKPRSEWMITNNRIPQIIEPSTLQKSIEIRGSKTNYKNSVGIYKGIKSEYGGLIVCGICGQAYTSNVETKNNKKFYNCRLKKGKGKSYCSNVNVYLEQIESTIESLCSGKLFDVLLSDRNANIAKIESKVLELLSKMDQKNLDEIKKLKKELEDIKLENKRLAILFVKGTINEELLNEMQKELDMQMVKLNGEIKDKSMSNNQIEDEIAKLRNTANSLKKIEMKSVYSKDEVIEQIALIEVRRDEVNQRKAHLDLRFKIFENIEKITQDV
ncbi:recombinase family protein [Paenibacillus odorifer]|uniref:recombinase family protein n=1 Tax=Paenibacillus odorifer TaxID=189426 RepID=UPI0009700F65|nr:recombinase family protein [Paenibacillus odorifer]OMD76910.1 hypothetical protein BSK50_14255 [Paenibacillus odorifer]